jgi:hypothetical protein
MTEKLQFPETVRREAEDIETKKMVMRLHLEASVPFAIHDLKKQGGPSAYHREKVRGYAWDIAGGGDALLYREKLKSAVMMSKLIESLAIMAFQPGGVTFLGLHFEVPASKEAGA